MIGRFGAPGPRTYTTRREDEATELWLSVKTAVVGSMALEAAVVILIMAGLSLRRGILPFMGVILGFVVFAALRMFCWEAVSIRVAVHTRTLVCLFGFLTGLAYMDKAWSWFEVGIVAAGDLVMDFIGPLKWPAIAIVLILCIYSLYQDFKGGLMLCLCLCVLWVYCYYHVFFPGTWLGGEHWATVWSRARIFSIPLLIPPNIFALALTVRMFVETVAGNTLPAQVMPVQYQGLGNLIFPNLFPVDDGPDVIEGEAEEVAPEPPPVQSFFLRQPNGKQDVSLDILVAEKRSGDGLEAWMRDVLHGRASISEEGSRTANGVRGIRHYGFLRRQWAGWQEGDVWIPGQLDRLKKAGLVQERKEGKGHELTEAGESFFVDRVSTMFGVRSIPKQYQSYLDFDEEAIKEKTTNEANAG